MLVLLLIAHISHDQRQHLGVGVLLARGDDRHLHAGEVGRPEVDVQLALARDVDRVG